MKKDSSDLNISHQDEERLPSEAEQQRSKLSKQFSQMMDNVQGNIFIAGQRLNDLTGYSAIEKLKKDIEFYGENPIVGGKPTSYVWGGPIAETQLLYSLESRLREARSLVRTTKETYSAAINRRSASQREVNELLQRKHAWSSADLERFTSLYRSDHANEVAEAESHEAITHAERELEEAASRLNRAMLSRYHEEQIWSDKIRRMSTWGTWGLMGVNVLLFLVFQIAVEPWRRQRLVRGFEDKVKQAIENTSQLSSTHVDMAVPRSTEIITGRPVEESVVPESGSEAGSVTTTNSPDMPTEPASSSHDSATLKPELRSMQHSFLTEDAMSFEYWTDYVLSFFSDRLVLLSQRDLTIVSLQSAAAGAAAMGLLIAIFRPHWSVTWYKILSSGLTLWIFAPCNLFDYSWGCI